MVSVHLKYQQGQTVRAHKIDENMNKKDLRESLFSNARTIQVVTDKRWKWEKIVARDGARRARLVVDWYHNWGCGMRKPVSYVEWPHQNPLCPHHKARNTTHALSTRSLCQNRLTAQVVVTCTPPTTYTLTARSRGPPQPQLSVISSCRSANLRLSS